jgi:peptide/nickel transport system substrate-binding protein
MEWAMPDKVEQNTLSTNAPASFSLAPSALSRRRFLAIGGTAVGAIGATSLLAACGSGAPAGIANTPSDTLTVGVFQEPDTLDPGATGLALSSLIASAVFDPLVWWLPTVNGDKQFYPGLATSWEVSPDATTYTFTLRQDVDFHDGTHFNAEAVKATFDHIVDPETKSRSAKGSLGPYQETRVVDEYTAQVVFSAPNAAFLHEMTTVLFGMASPQALKKYGPTGFGNNPVGTGPFSFVSYAAQDHVSLTKNPNYKWGPEAFGAPGPAKLQNLDFRILLDSTARYNALQAGQIQMAMNLNPSDIQTIRNTTGLTHYNVPSTGQPYGYPLNVKKTPTDDLLVRQAINLAVDQNTLVQSVLMGAYEPAHNVLTPTTPGYDKSLDTMYAYNPDKAKALLDQAGWVAGQDGTRSKNGQPLEVEILIQSSNGFDLPTQFVVSQLKAVGVAATTSSEPFTTAAQSYNNGVQNLSAIFYYDVDPYLLKNLVTTEQIQSGFNWAHYSNSSVDSGIAQANATMDDTTRSGQYQQVTQTLMEDAIFLPLWNVSGIFSAASNLKGLNFGTTGYALFHAAELA